MHINLAALTVNQAAKAKFPWRRPPLTYLLSFPIRPAQTLSTDSNSVPPQFRLNILTLTYPYMKQST